MQYQYFPFSPLGYLLAGFDSGYLVFLSFKDKEENVPSLSSINEEAVKRLADWISQYRLGQPLPISSVPMKIQETEFQRQVYRCLCNIPYGSSSTYGRLAKDISLLTKKKVSAQAVGQALSKNPLVLLLPCHRILKEGNGLSGYAYGKERKRYLLDWEKIPYRDD